MNCPLCNGSNCLVQMDSSSNNYVYNCSVFHRNFGVSSSVEVRDKSLQMQLNNLIFEFVIRRPTVTESGRCWRFFYSPEYKLKDTDESYHVNLAELPYPKNHSEKMDRVLLNLYYINSSAGYEYAIMPAFYRAVFADTEDEEKSFGGVFLLLHSDYLIEIDSGLYAISPKGWQRIEELQRQAKEFKQAFIAMAFRDETKPIRESFRKAIISSGYKPLAIDEKEHNNQIVPEIFHEIDNSMFLVMDVTVPNFGAYYEAGYALGKGKQVIACCRKEEFENADTRPHFDIAQKSIIVWETEEELVSKLIKRIEATIR